MSAFLRSDAEIAWSDLDRAMMQQCLELAQQALGCTAPNPLVGCVIVKEGAIVGMGFHPKAGEPHAEVFALRQAGEAARGATLYVNLEPCNHYGRTPPCTEAIIAAGIGRVVVGMVDPNPQVAGTGMARLRTAGIEVAVGVEAATCRRLNEAFVHRMVHHRPFGILKYAMTLDGKIAASTGHSSWVTGQAARRAVHQLRAACDAVIIGGNTVRQDNPRLTTHGVASHNPLRVVMSRSLHLPTQAHLWQTDEAPTLVLTQAGANPTVKTALQEQGVAVVELDDLTPEAALRILYDRSALSVLWECGGTLAAAALQAGTVQKIWAFIAPKIIGGTTAPTPMGDLGLSRMSDAIPIEDISVRRIDSDLLVEGYIATDSLRTPSVHLP
jgi:diaminohydroxyphosphoribosylaminopyrimidine deaminase/5-amino-6-(5-phosphoribosylamino)uracil reductase